MSNVVTIRLDHGKANALDREMCERLLRELDQAERAGAAVVIAASGPIFSAGIDLFKLVEGGEANVRKFLPLAMEVFRRIFVHPRPVVAAVNGHAMAGGCVIALAADYSVMAEGSGRIGLTELAVGIPFPAVILEMARYSLPHRYFHEVIYFARTYEPREALLKGLVDEVVAPDALASRASEVAAQLASVPADTFRLTKMQMRRVDQLPRADVIEPVTVDAWIRALADDRVRSYIDRTIRKKS